MAQKRADRVRLALFQTQSNVFYRSVDSPAVLVHISTLQAYVSSEISKVHVLDAILIGFEGILSNGKRDKSVDSKSISSLRFSSISNEYSERKG